MTSEATHPAVVTVAIRGPLEILQVPTVKPGAGEIRVEVHWIGSTPLDLHQADGGLLVNHPQVLGDSVVGEVVEVGSNVSSLNIGDIVFGFAWASQKEKGQQQFITAAANLFGKPSSYIPQTPDRQILIWGGSSSVGQYALQILKYYGYNNIFAVASKRHHDLLKSFGATKTFDYNDTDILSSLRTALGGSATLVLDCIGSQEGSLLPLSKVVPRGSKVAVLLPVILKHASNDDAPEYSMETQSVVPWVDGVQAVGVRTHSYLQNEFNAEHLQPTIMPTLLAEGVIKPNNYRIVEGPTLLARAQKALDILRGRQVSGERLVWRVTE